MRSQSASRYIHGSESNEQKRLSHLNALLNEACLREISLRPAQTVLDVGSGLGQFTRAMANTVGPDGTVIGVERDKRQLAEARRQAKADGEADLVEWRHGDALSLPLQRAEWGRFDVVHTRFVLEHVRQPEILVRQMVAAASPGGRIVLADDDHQILRLWPELPGFEPLWNEYIRAYEHMGCDPFIGRRLVSLLQVAGAKPVRNHWIFFGSCAGAPEFPAFVNNLIGVIKTAHDVMTGPLGFSPRQFDRTLRALREWGKRPDSALWYGLCWAEGVRE